MCRRCRRHGRCGYFAFIAGSASYHSGWARAPPFSLREAPLRAPRKIAVFRQSAPLAPFLVDLPTPACPANSHTPDCKKLVPSGVRLIKRASLVCTPGSYLSSKVVAFGDLVSGHSPPRRLSPVILFFSPFRPHSDPGAISLLTRL